MIFITDLNSLINIDKNTYTRHTLFYEAIHMALFQKSLNIPNFTLYLAANIQNKIS